MSYPLNRAVLIACLSLQFGRVERVTRHEDGVRPETDTDHTVMLALLACDLVQVLGLDLDIGLVAQFALVHDFREVYAGDAQTLTITPEARAAKEAREAEAGERLRTEFGDGSWLVSMMDRYELQSTPEARFVRVLDKITPKLTHLLNGCVAAKALTDYAGFERSHRTQAADLLARYPDVAAEVHKLLKEAMEASEARWPVDREWKTLDDVANAAGDDSGLMAAGGFPDVCARCESDDFGDDPSDQIDPETGLCGMCARIEAIETTKLPDPTRRSKSTLPRKNEAMGGLTDKGCWSCTHCDDVEEGCMQPDLYDLDNESNEAEGTSAEMGEAIRAWRDSAAGYDALAVTAHDEPCPGWEEDEPCP